MGSVSLVNGHFDEDIKCEKCGTILRGKKCHKCGTEIDYSQNNKKENIGDDK